MFSLGFPGRVVLGCQPDRNGIPELMIEIPQTPSTLRLVPLARLAAGGRWRVEAMRSYSEPVLLWFTKGQGRITVAGVTRGYGAHNAIYLPPGTMHGFEVSAQGYGSALFFGRRCDVALPDVPLHLRIRDTASQVELGAILENIQRESESDRTGAERAARCHLGLLGVWLERQSAAAAGAPVAQPARSRAAHRLAARYAALLERDFRSSMGVTDYAAALGVTPTHLTRCCRQSCDRSAHDLLQDRILFEARRLLADTRVPVKDVSESLGFTSPAYFTRAFQNHTGKTPTDFRKGA